MRQYRSIAEVDAVVERTKATILDLERYDFRSSNTGRHTPFGMSIAFMLSMSQRWKWFFLRKHGVGVDQQINELNPADWDNSERVKGSKDIIEEYLLKAIFVYDGNDDTNCMYADTKALFDLLKHMYPTRYSKSQELIRRTKTTWQRNSI
jgi:hypothetical protein